MHLYMQARDQVSAAVRMNLIGPLEGARVLAVVAAEAKVVVDGRVVEGGEVDVDEAFVCVPWMEIMGDAHERLYTRLFNS